IVLKDAPDWTKYVLYTVFAYAFVTSIPTWIETLQKASGPHPASGLNGWEAFSAVWMVFYWASFAILYSAQRQEQLGPRCVKGHPGLPGTRFCAECGQPIVRS